MIIIKKEVSKKLGVPRTTLTEWLYILELKPAYQEAVITDDNALSLAHVSLARGLARRTGDPTKLYGLLDGVLQYNLTTKETKAVVNLFADYLHLSLKEALQTILIKREQRKVAKSMKERSREQQSGINKLLNIFNRVSTNLEEFMEEVGSVEKKSCPPGIAE